MNRDVHKTSDCCDGDGEDREDSFLYLLQLCIHFTFAFAFYTLLLYGGEDGEDGEDVLKSL